MGARVLRLANATVDTQVVEHRFEEMTKSLDRSVDELARRIDDSARALLDDENGELTAALRTWLTDVTDALGATFDETSKKSAIAKLEALLESARAEQVAAVRRLLDPENERQPAPSLALRDRRRGSRSRRGRRAAPQRPQFPPRPRSGRGGDDRPDRRQGLRLRGCRLRDDRVDRRSAAGRPIPGRQRDRRVSLQGRRHRRRHRPVLREGRRPVRRSSARTARCR